MLGRLMKTATPDSFRGKRAAVVADREKLAPQIEKIETQIAALEAQHESAVLESDAAAEANEAERRRLGYEKTRLVKRLAALDADERRLTDEIADAEAAANKTEAERAVAAAVAGLRGYGEAVTKIAAFLDAWKNADALAKAAGIPGPDETGRAPRLLVPAQPARFAKVMRKNYHGDPVEVEEQVMMTQPAEYFHLPSLDEIRLPPGTHGGPRVNCRERL